MSLLPYIKNALVFVTIQESRYGNYNRIININ